MRHPGPVRFPAHDVRLDLLIVDDASLDGIHQEHAARLEAALLADILGFGGKHTGLGGQHHEVV